MLDQARDKIKMITDLDVAYEKAQETAIDSDKKIVVASIQTISKESRLKKYPRNYFGAIVIDEAHHCTTGSYQRVLKYFKDAYVLGVTATPDRTDKLSLSTYFDSQAYEYGIKDGILNGYLCPIKAKLIPVKIDIRKVAKTAGDFNVGMADKAIEPYLDEIAKIIAKDYADRKTLIFLPLIKTSVKMAELLNKYGIPAVEINGQTPDRAGRSL